MQFYQITVFSSHLLHRESCDIAHDERSAVQKLYVIELVSEDRDMVAGNELPELRSYLPALSADECFDVG